MTPSALLNPQCQEILFVFFCLRGMGNFKTKFWQLPKIVQAENADKAVIDVMCNTKAVNGYFYERNACTIHSSHGGQRSQSTHRYQTHAIYSNSAMGREVIYKSIEQKPLKEIY